LRYYRFGAGWVLRQRLKWARDALPGERFSRLLEIGYGSGVFMHELGKHTLQLFGTDVHAHGAQVKKRLATSGTLLNAVRSSGDALPFRDGAFDAVVMVSALEYMGDPGLALREAVRVVRPGGAVVCVTPRGLRWTERLYSFLLRFDPDSRDRGGRAKVQAALADQSLRAERFPRPRLAPKFLAPYELIVLRRMPAGGNGKSAAPAPALNGKSA
jgi:SAM-dependent methyltransferase